jgi:hypothetical protein
MTATSQVLFLLRMMSLCLELKAPFQAWLWLPTGSWLALVIGQLIMHYLAILSRTMVYDENVESSESSNETFIMNF